MKDSIIKFGPNQSLLGILTEPDVADLVPNSPVAVILNAGITHRVGPFRLHVHLARKLAELGFRSFRIDISGVGDSQIRGGKLEMSARAQLDVSDAFDALTSKLSDDQFVLIGLCSGAFNSHNISVSDKRVVGAVFMDGIAFRTVGFHVRRAMRYLRPRFWRNAVKRRFLNRSSASTANSDSQALAETNFFDINDLDQESTKHEIESLVDRGVRMLFLYTDGYDDVCGREQFKEMFGLEPNNALLQLEYYEKSEHTFRLTANRETAIKRVAEWYTSGFADSESNKALSP